MRYAIRTEPPVHEESRELDPFFPGRTRLVCIDHTPWEWRRFSPEGFHSDAPPFWADIELPPGRVWVAFAVEQQGHRGEWSDWPALDDWVLEVEEAEGGDPRSS